MVKLRAASMDFSTSDVVLVPKLCRGPPPATAAAARLGEEHEEEEEEEVPGEGASGISMPWPAGRSPDDNRAPPCGGVAIDVSIAAAAAEPAATATTVLGVLPSRTARMVAPCGRTYPCRTFPATPRAAPGGVMCSITCFFPDDDDDDDEAASTTTPDNSCLAGSTTVPGRATAPNDTPTPAPGIIAAAAAAGPKVKVVVPPGPIACVSDTDFFSVCSRVAVGMGALVLCTVRVTFLRGEREGRVVGEGTLMSAVGRVVR